MIIVDNYLEKREREGNPVRVGMVGAGYMGRGVALQFLTSMTGMRLVAIANRTVSEAERAYREAGVDVVDNVERVDDLDNAIRHGRYSITDNPLILCEAAGIDVIIEVTGEVEFGAKVALHAIEHAKHVVLMNAELDATVGPILKVFAEKKGVVVTNSDGDQPGVIMNLFRFVKAIGYHPVLAGNIKGLQDPYRNPDTQRGFAEKHCQKPRMVTSFADGTKISMEMAVVANATGFGVGKRGMYGVKCKHVTETPKLFPVEGLLQQGIVDYVLGAEPGPGIFVIGFNDHPAKRQYLEYLKMGEGPFYVFYTPYHLCHLEVPLTAARAVLFGDAAVTPLGAPVCEVVTVAKRDLSINEELDGHGGFTCYGVIENAEVCRAENILPMGLAEGCRLRRNVPKDQALTFDDVDLPPGRLCEKLWNEQLTYFNSQHATPVAS